MLTLIVLTALTVSTLVKMAMAKVDKVAATTTKSFKLYKAMRGRTGVVVGLNQFGSLWVELRLRGKKVASVSLIDKNPRKAAKKDTARVPYGWESVSSRTIG
jgi:hypothetical protein